MSLTSVLGRNAPALLAAAALVVTGGLIASADPLAAPDGPTAGSGVAPADQPGIAPGGEASAAPSDEPSGRGRGAGPDPTGPAGHGLCNAWSHGGLGEGSTARRNLEEAAGGAAGVEAFCAVVLEERRAHRGGPGNAAERRLIAL